MSDEGVRARINPDGNCPSCPLPVGTNECHCSACGRHFSTVTNFDMHRRAGACQDPAGLGMVEMVRRGSARVWVRPMAEPRRHPWTS